MRYSALTLSAVILLGTMLFLGPIKGSLDEMVIGYGGIGINVTGDLYTGDEINLTVSIDNATGLTSSWLHYNWSASVPASFENSSISLDGFRILTNPLNRTDPFWVKAFALYQNGSIIETDWNRYNITDNDPPIFVSDLTDPHPYTGDGFLIGAEMDDNIGIKMCDVSIWLGGNYSGKYALCGAGNSRQSLLMLPLQSRGSLQYRFDFNDDAGNNGTSPIFTKMMVDNDAPVLIEDRSDLNAATGEDLSISMEVSDNWGVNSSWANITFTTGPHLNVSLGRDGKDNYTHTLKIPLTATGLIIYQCGFQDESGNLLLTKERIVGIRDNDPPSMIQDLSDKFATTGEKFRFEMEAIDNVRIKQADVLLWQDDEGPYNLFLEHLPDDRYGVDYLVHDTSLPSDMQIRYSFRFSDGFNDPVFSDLKTIPILDNDRPEFISDISDIGAQSGEDMALGCLVKDNVEIAEVQVTYQLPGGDERIMGMDLVSKHKAGSEYRTVIQIPGDSSGDLEYSFRVVDGFGNWVGSGSLSISIVDRTSPELGVIRFQDDDVDVLSLTTGDDFKVIADCRDNIGVDSVLFTYMVHGSSFPVEMPLEKGLTYNGSSQWSTDFLIPPYGKGPMSYRFKVRDASNNSHETDWFTIDVLDNDPPVILDVICPPSVLCNEVFNITVRTSENTNEIYCSLILPGSFELLRTYPRNGYIFQYEVRSKEGPTGDQTIKIRISDSSFDIEGSMNITLVDNIEPSVDIEIAGEEFSNVDRIDLKASIYDNDDWEIIEIYAITDGISLILTDLIFSGSEVLGSFYPSSYGNWQIKVEARDPAGNIGGGTLDIFVLDKRPPAFQLKIDEELALEGRIYCTIADLTEETTSSDPSWTVTGPDGEKMTYDSLSIDIETWGSGDYHIEVEISDASGNVGMEDEWITIDEGRSSNGPDIVFWILIIISGIAGIAVIWSYVRGKIFPDEEHEDRKD